MSAQIIKFKNTSSKGQETTPELQELKDFILDIKNQANTSDSNVSKKDFRYYMFATYLMFILSILFISL